MYTTDVALLALFATLLPRFVSGGVQTCSASAPDFQLCLRAALQRLIPELSAGVPSIGAEGVDPLQGLPPIAHSSPGLGVRIDDVSIRGLSGTVIKDVNMDLASNTLRIQATVNGLLTVTGVHSTDATIMGIPLKGSGPFTISMANPSLSLTLTGTPVSGPDGRTYLRLTYAHADIDPGTPSADIKGFFTQFPPLEAAASAFASMVAASAIQEMKPSLDKWLGAVALQRAQAVFNSVPYTTLFPGRSSAILEHYSGVPVVPLSTFAFQK